jgi:hypothetical protein
MVTTPPSFESTEEVLNFIPESEIERLDMYEEEEILNNHICSHKKPKYIKREDSYFYRFDKTGVAICEQCGGYYGILLPNHY